MDILQHILSLETWHYRHFGDVISYERKIGCLYKPMPNDVSQTVSACLNEYDLPTLFAINDVLINLINLIRWSRAGRTTHNECKNNVTAIIERFVDTKNIFNCLNFNGDFMNEICRLTGQIGKKKHFKPALKNFPALQSFFILQQIVQERIEAATPGQSKAASFLESFAVHPRRFGSDEAIIYCLGKNETSGRIKAFLDFYQFGKVAVHSYSNAKQFTSFLRSKQSTLKTAIDDYQLYLPEENNHALVKDKSNLVEYPNSLRFFDNASVRHLQRLFLQELEWSIDRRRQTYFNLTAPFRIFKSDLSILLMRKELEIFLAVYANFFDNVRDRRSRRFNVILDIDILELASLFIFGCHRTQSSLRNTEMYGKALEYIVDWGKEFTQKSDGPKNGHVTSVSMAVHALHQAHFGVVKNFTEQIESWLLSKQHKYGYWYDQKKDDNPIFTTVMVLDAIELMKDVPHPTFDTNKPIFGKKQKVPPQKQGRPQNRTDEDLKLMQNAYEECYRECNDSKSAWNKVARTFGAKSGGAVRVACMRLKKKLQ